MKTPTVSVIIPTHNYGLFIGQSLASVFAQTYRDFEVIVVDDGSTDDTRKRVARFPQARYIYHTKHNVLATIARGIAEARGCYAAMLDADDLWLPQKLEVQMQIFSADPTAGLVSCGYECIDEFGHLLPQRSMPRIGSILDLEGGSSCLPSSWVAPISLWRRFGEPHRYISHPWDWDFLLHLVSCGLTVRTAPAYLVRRRIHVGQDSSDFRRLLAGKLRVIHRRHRNLAASADHLRWRDMLYATYLEAATESAARDRIEDAGLYLRRAILLRPNFLSRPASFYGILTKMSPYGFQTIKNAARHLGEYHSKVRQMLAIAAHPSGRLAARRRTDFSTSYAALGLGACLVCFQAGAIPKAVSWFGRTFVETPRETARVLGLAAARRVSGRSQVRLPSADGVQGYPSSQPAAPSRHENHAGSTT